MRTYEYNAFMNEKEHINIILMKNDMECDLHTHEFVELIFVAVGSCEQYIDGVKYHAEAGDLLFVNYGQTHTFTAISEEFIYYNLLYVPDFFSEELMNSENIYEIFQISMFQEFMEEESENRRKEELAQRKEAGAETAGITGSQKVSFKDAEYPGILKIIEDMYQEFREKEIGYHSVLNGYSRVLFSKILRKLKGGRVSREARQYLKRITDECLAYIDARCFEKITLKEIAEHTFYNPFYFSRIFKEQCGISLSEYIKEKRMTEAARLLQTTRYSNDEVMEKVGYTDKKQFYQNFKEIYGLTPSQFRHR